jgi:hypothetical protein
MRPRPRRPGMLATSRRGLARGFPALHRDCGEIARTCSSCVGARGAPETRLPR